MLCREGSARGFGIRLPQSVEGSDSWIDDPITRHIISLCINKEVEGENYLLWPLIMVIKGQHCVLVLPLVEPLHFKAYARMCKRSDCGNAVGVDGSLSSLLLDLRSITGYGKLCAILFTKYASETRFSCSLGDPKEENCSFSFFEVSNK